ncbi:MAG TPA: aquaporin, partial [Gemmatimonadales bacterium]|nr:aquaporin [Gemmatimonadales bacterium]
ALALVFSQEVVAATTTRIGTGVEPFGGFVWEALLTAGFVMAILVLTKGGGTRTRLLGIGLTLTAVHLAGLGISGASVNPARSFGPALVGAEWTDIWVYIVGPVFGAVLAWVLYKVIVKGELDFTVGSEAAATAKPAPARRATAPARPTTAARKPAARKPAPRKK